MAEDLLGKTLARFNFLMNRWLLGWVDLPVPNDEAETRNQINRWLSEFERTFKNGTLAVNLAGGHEGFGDARTPAELSSANDLFLKSYENQIKALSSFDQTEARLLRNDLAITFGERWREMYASWDAFMVESTALGMTLQEQVDAFMSKPAFRNSVNLVDSAGRKWRPDHYSTMYARTRGREVENEISMREIDNLDLDIVKISTTATKTPICKKYIGMYFSLTGATQGLPVLPFSPPFHPNCVHHVISTRTTAEEAAALNSLRNYTPLPSEQKTILKQEAWLLRNRPNKVAA